MSLPVDDRFVSAQLNLIKQRDGLLKRKKQLLSEFRAFATKKIKTHGTPFRIKYRAINGDVKKYYQDLEIGEQFFLECGSFTFDPKTSLLRDCERIELKAVKTVDDFDEFTKTTTSRPFIIKKRQQNLSLAAEIEREKIAEKMQRKIDKILVGIFKNELSFEDPEFKRLVDATVAIEQELRELNTRIAALDMVNTTSGIDMEAAITRNAKMNEIMQVLSELDDAHMQSAPEKPKGRKK